MNNIDAQTMDVLRGITKTFGVGPLLLGDNQHWHDKAAVMAQLAHVELCRIQGLCRVCGLEDEKFYDQVCPTCAQILNDEEEAWRMLDADVREATDV